MKQNLEQVFNSLKEKGYKIIGPTACHSCEGRNPQVFFKEINSPKNITLDYINPALSIKEWFFPRTEAVMEYENQFKKDAKIIDVEIPDVLTAIIGVRPCDAKSLSILDEVFSWDYKDDFYIKRRKNTLIVTLACDKIQQDCFCDKLGVALDSDEGADILLKKNNNDFELNAVTEKGKTVFPDAELKSKKAALAAEKLFDTQKIKKWLDGNFENEFWKDAAMKCLGCGACAFVCPTCHCFDIVDEACYTNGCRRKNWDSCGFSTFTLHTSGHNPRPAQQDRFRNRVMHKFKYYEDKFKKIACVGCGRCKRLCPVRMNLKEHLGKIETL